MRILFCTPVPLTKSLGAAKVVVELAEEMRELGWECDLVSIRDLADQSGLSMCKSLRGYLLEHAANYDVVDYDHEYLPYPRSEFSPQPLFVARSVLLAHHLETIPIPTGRGVKAQLGVLLKGRSRAQARRERVCRAQVTVEQADLVNVSNDDDKAELMRRGIPAEKIVVVSYGISRVRRLLFDQVSSAPPSSPVVAFVGTFDYRKGAREFPQIVQAIVDAVPSVRFRLLGAKGLYKTEREVLRHFSPRMATKMEVVLKFQPEELPQLLSACSVGVFPSYIEGMPFGVLEMLAASVPVIAYDAPGPPMLLPVEHLVPRGDARAMSKKIVALLEDSLGLAAARCSAKRMSRQFDWTRAAQETHNVYAQPNVVCEDFAL